MWQSSCQYIAVPIDSTVELDDHGVIPNLRKISMSILKSEQRMQICEIVRRGKKQCHHQNRVIEPVFSAGILCSKASHRWCYGINSWYSFPSPCFPLFFSSPISYLLLPSRLLRHRFQAQGLGHLPLSLPPSPGAALAEQAGSPSIARNEPSSV